MPTAFDAKFPPKALQLLNAYGADGVYRSLQLEEYDTTTGTTDASYVNYSVKTLLSSSSRGNKADTSARDDMSTALIAAQGLPVTPKVGDVLSFGGVDRRVVRGVPTYSGEQIALWQVQLAS